MRRIADHGAGVMLTCRVPPALADALEDRARTEGRTVSALVRESLAFSLGLGHVAMTEAPRRERAGAPSERLAGAVTRSALNRWSSAEMCGDAVCEMCGERLDDCEACGEAVCDVCDGDRCPTCGACRGEDAPAPA